MKRRNILQGSVALAGLALLGGGVFHPRAVLAAEEIFEDDRIMGDVEAPVTIIEYASVTCGACGNFHNVVLPTLKEDWIDSGRARLVYRDYPRNRLDFEVMKIMRCIEENKRFFGFVDAIYEKQADWTRAEDPMAEIAKIARLAGMSDETVEACRANEALGKAIIEKAKHGQSEYGVRSTPTLVINGKVYPGTPSYEDLNQRLESAA